MADTSIRTYRSKRDFSVTTEPAPDDAATAAGRLFVVQKHAAHRAGVHWDFRLEHGGVLWSWAVPRGPSLDPAVRRMAVHVEDHPVGYATFQGVIPAGQYGAGTVETWDHGTWHPLDDPEAGMAKGHLHFTLNGARLRGRFSLVRTRNRGKQEAWFLVKHEDEFARAGSTAEQIEEQLPLLAQGEAPAAGAVERAMPVQQEPALCSLARQAPAGDTWLSEIKFDGYRILAAIEDGTVRLLTRTGLDWADRMPHVAAAFRASGLRQAMIDGELVALRADGRSSFPGLQSALKTGRDDTLVFYAFDLLHLDGWDLRPCTLADRKALLRRRVPWSSMLRYSEHVATDPAALLETARGMNLEGIVCKRADSRYRPGRGGDWLKVKCQGREELVVLGWTPPGGSRAGFGALHLGYYDPAGQLHYAGGVGSGFDAKALRAISQRLASLKAPAPPDMLVSGDPIDPAVTWVRPELVAEIEFTDWSGAGRVRHAVFLGLREDKPARDVVRETADPEAERAVFKTRRGVVRKSFHGAIPPLPKPPLVPVRAARPTAQAARIVTAKAPQKARILVGHVELSHADRELWPGITKRHLAEYWQAVAPHALPELARRPLSILRCPDGIAGETFFQKNGHGYLPHQIREGHAGGQPFLAIDDLDGLIAMAQMSAIELHAWGATEQDALHPDQLVFDLDPGEGVAFPAVVQAALEVRQRLQALGLESFCRTTGGKGLHVVAPLRPDAGWDAVKPFCRAFAETMEAEAPDRFVAHLKIADRSGKILVDWLRNGLGSTAVSSFCPRARPGAGVATPLAWREVTPKLDPAAFTLLTVPKRLARLMADPWAGLRTTDQVLPTLKAAAAEAKPAPRVPGTRIVTARKPKPR